MNNWSCLPAAFAKCIGISLKEMIRYIGHDGGAVAWPSYPSPLNRRGFHIQEILHVVHMLEFSAMPVGPNPRLSNGPGPYMQIKDELFDKAKLKLGVHLGVTDAGINHAVAFLPTAGFWCPSRGDWIDSFHTREIWLVNKCS